ncbi:MAG: hypothetical protein HFG80_13700 [Eubacterium sp.]|nr:hypothetical protein [Eubacterium sp.]
MKNMKTVAAAVFFTMMALFLPSMTVSAASLGITVSQNTMAKLQAVHYENNETIGKLLAPSRYSSSDKLNKKTEIALREGKSPADITDEQAINELNQDNKKVMSFEESFAEVQANIGEIIRKIVDSTAGAESKDAAYFTDKILQNKEKLLLGLAYLNRLYNFDMGGHNIRDVLLYEPGSYGVSTDVLDWLIQIGGAGGDTLKLSNNANVFGYRKLFWSVTSSATLDAFLEENRQKWIPNTPMNEWFLQESPADILENSSDWDNKNNEIYQRLYHDETTRAHILPLLTVSEDSVYLIANSATITYGIVDCYIDRNLRKTNPARYGELRKKFRQQLEQAAVQQKAFIDFWYRIAKPEKKGLLSSNRIVLDSLRIDPDTTVQWSDKFGENAARGVREFFTPLNLYDNYMFADGVAEGTRIRYYISKALTERGFATYAHELTHMLVSEVMLNGYGSRDGMLAEVYTRGMFEPYELNDPPAFNLNLIYDREAIGDRYHNGLPEHFQTEADLQSYMSGILDVVYTLDYTEADVIFSKSPEEKMKWFHKLEQTEDPDKRVNQGEDGSKHNLDSVRDLTLDEAKNLNTIDDLIRDSILVSRYEVNGTKTSGTMARNGYYVVPLFSANYAGVQNNYGVSGDVMIRRQAFELLAEYGYYNGMVPYISNQYKEAAKSEQTILSDQYILKKISGGTYETMADFKKAMFQKRIDKISELKPVTITWKNQSVTITDFETLRLLMKEAVENDLVNVNVLPGGYNNIRAQATEVERLKQEIFKAYLIQTEDFKESIYKTSSTPITPSGPGVTPGDTDTDPPQKPGSNNMEQTQKPDNNDTQQIQKPDAGTAQKNTAPKLLLCTVSSAKTSNTLRWNSVKSADGYEIYGAKSNGKYKRLKTVSKKSVKWKHQKLKKGTKYKYYVKAYKKINGKRVVLAKSISLYSITKGGRYNNPSKIRATKTRVSVKSGKKVRLRVTVTGKKINKTGKKVSYVSSNPSVAKVSKTGVVTGKKRGTCTIYCIAQNGLYKKVKVTVKRK